MCEAESYVSAGWLSVCSCWSTPRLMPNWMFNTCLPFSEGERIVCLLLLDAKLKINGLIIPAEELRFYK